MEKGKFDKAFQALCRLRKHKIQAARDMYYAYKLLEIETAEREGRNAFKEFFTVRRNRRAAQSAFFVMFMQQFCGVNVRTMRCQIRVCSTVADSIDRSSPTIVPRFSRKLASRHLRLCLRRWVLA
jgi:hypothetical protein